MARWAAAGFSARAEGAAGAAGFFLCCLVLIWQFCAEKKTRDARVQKARRPLACYCASLSWGQAGLRGVCEREFDSARVALRWALFIVNYSHEKFPDSTTDIPTHRRRPVAKASWKMPAQKDTNTQQQQQQQQQHEEECIALQGCKPRAAASEPSHPWDRVSVSPLRASRQAASSTSTSQQISLPHGTSRGLRPFRWQIVPSPLAKCHFSCPRARFCPCEANGTAHRTRRV